MRIARAVIIPAILALGAAGSILAAPVAAQASAAHAPAAHVQSHAASVRPLLHYHA